MGGSIDFDDDNVYCDDCGELIPKFYVWDMADRSYVMPVVS